MSHSCHAASQLLTNASKTLTDVCFPDVLASKQVTVKFVQDTSKFWYKPDISRDQGVCVAANRNDPISSFTPKSRVKVVFLFCSYFSPEGQGAGLLRYP